MRAMRFKIALRRAYQAACMVEHIFKQFGTHRDRHFGRRCWRRCSHISGVVDESRVCLMTDSRDQWDLRAGSCPHDNLLIDSPKIHKANPTACNDEHIGSW